MNLPSEVDKCGCCRALAVMRTSAGQQGQGRLCWRAGFMDSAVALGEGPLQAIEAQRESERAEQHAAPPPSASRPPLSLQRAPASAGSAQGSAPPPPPAVGADPSEAGLLDPNPEGLGVKRDGSTSPPADPSVVLARAAAAAEGFGLAMGEPPSGDGITAEQRVAAAGFGAVPPAANDGAVRTASTAVTVGPEEVAEAECLLRASAAEADAEAVRPVSSLHLLLRVALHCLVRNVPFVLPKASAYRRRSRRKNNFSGGA